MALSRDSHSLSRPSIPAMGEVVYPSSPPLKGGGGVRSTVRESKPLTTMMAAALAWAAHYVPVFPIFEPSGAGCSCGVPGCSDVGKHPRTPNGWKDATTNDLTIRRWWQRWPSAGIGIATGLAGWLVIDPDVQGLEAWHDLARRLHLPSTLTVQTGGGGLHVVYRQPAGTQLGNSIGSLPAGIHVRGAGGYIVAAPSLHKSGQRYRIVGETRIAALLPEALTRLLIPPPTTAPPRVRQDGRLYVQGDPLPEGQRNAGLYRVACAWRGRHGLSLEEIEANLLEANATRCVPPLPERDVTRIARSACRYPAAGGRS